MGRILRKMRELRRVLRNGKRGCTRPQSSIHRFEYVCYEPVSLKTSFKTPAFPFELPQFSISSMANRAASRLLRHSPVLARSTAAPKVARASSQQTRSNLSSSSHASRSLPVRRTAAQAAAARVVGTAGSRRFAHSGETNEHMVSGQSSCSLKWLCMARPEQQALIGLRVSIKICSEC